MRWKRHSPEEIASKLSQARELIERGVPVSETAKLIGVAEPTLFRWRRDYEGLKFDQIRKMKQLEAENARLRRAVAELEVTPEQDLRGLQHAS